MKEKWFCNWGEIDVYIYWGLRTCDVGTCKLVRGIIRQTLNMDDATSKSSNIKSLIVLSLDFWISCQLNMIDDYMYVCNGLNAFTC